MTIKVVFLILPKIHLMDLAGLANFSKILIYQEPKSQISVDYKAKGN
jgi:hypothetical protein